MSNGNIKKVLKNHGLHGSLQVSLVISPERILDPLLDCLF